MTSLNHDEIAINMKVDNFQAVASRGKKNTTNLYRCKYLPYPAPPRHIRKHNIFEHNQSYILNGRTDGGDVPAV